MYVQASFKYNMCEPSLRGEEVSGDGVGEDEGDNVLSLTDDDLR